MKMRYLGRCVLFLLPVVALLVGAEARLRFASPSVLKFKKAYLEEALPGIEVLIVGTSHEYWGIDPEEFHRPGFNLAADSQSLYYSRALVDRFERRLPRLKCVVLGMSYFSLEFGLAGSPESYRQLDYWDVFGISPEAGWNRENLKDSIVILRRGVPLARELLWKSFFGHVDPNAPLPQKNGWQDTGTTVEPDSTGGGDVRARLHAGMMNPKLFDANVARVKDMLDGLRKRGVSVILVTLPAQLSYRSNIYPDRLERMQQAIASLLAGREDLVRYLNYFADPRFVEEDFGSSDHLNSPGARKFSQVLDREALTGL